MNRHNPQFIAGLQEIAERYDHFIIDIYGVLHDGIEAFPDTLECLSQLKAAGKEICLLSNSPRRAPGTVFQMENYFGIPRGTYDHIVTSGEATYNDLKTRKEILGERCWFIGKSVMEEVTDGLGYTLLDDPANADFVLNSIPELGDRDRAKLMRDLQTAADKNMPMLCANPDLVVNIGPHQYECAGTFAAHYETLGGAVTYHGKPHAPVYEWAWELLGRPPKGKILAIGDSLHTDIAGANGFGIDSCFNLVGIHWEEVQLDHSPGTTDLAKIRHILETQAHSPTYSMAGFNW